MAERKLVINVASQMGETVSLQVRKDTKLAAVHEKVCSRLGIDSSSARMLYNGKKVDLKKTLEQLKVESDDFFDIVQEQVGG